MEQTIITQQNELQHSEPQKYTYVCPFCLRSMEKDARCVCNKPGTIRTPKQTVQSRIEHLTENNRHKILEIIQLLEDRESKRKKVQPNVFADQATPPTNSSKVNTDDIVTWENNFALMRCMIALDEYTQIDEAIGALQAIQERIDENDFQTKSVISCIKVFLLDVYETLQDRRKSAVRAFNKCFPDDTINV